MTPLQTEATKETSKETPKETTASTRLCKRSHARRWTFFIPIFCTWRDQEGAPNTYEIRDISTSCFASNWFKALELEVEILHDRAEAAQQQTEDLQDSLWRARDEIVEHQIHHEDVDARLQQSKFREMEHRARIRRLEDLIGM
ncbi:hypothetical protein Tco_1046076 [Tanacetum coccineum]